LTPRQVVASELADLHVRLAAIDAQRQRIEAEVGPVRYLAELFGSHDLEHAVRCDDPPDPSQITTCRKGAIPIQLF